MWQVQTIFFRYVEPIFVLALFAAIPIARSNSGAAFAFPDLSQGAFLGISGIWLWMSYRFFTPPPPAHRPRPLLFALCALCAFVFLCVSGAFFLTLAAETEIPRFRCENPALLIAVIVIAAFFEEILYRAYLPAKLRFFVPRKIPPRFVPEILCAILFSAAHLRGGAFSALNALFAGAALHICFAKTKSVVLTGSVHAAYNIVALAWLSRDAMFPAA
jgi:membrane protease YdiL (CAAX protease family)